MTTVITVDFDNTLSRKDVQEYVKELMTRGIDVWVVTSRYDDLHAHLYPKNSNNLDLWAVVDELGIPRYKVKFTNMDFKSTYLNNAKVLLHLDDDWKELRYIQKNTIVIPIQVNSPSYKHKINKILNAQEVR